MINLENGELAISGIVFSPLLHQDELLDKFRELKLSSSGTCTLKATVEDMESELYLRFSLSSGLLRTLQIFPRCSVSEEIQRKWVKYYEACCDETRKLLGKLIGETGNQKEAAVFAWGSIGILSPFDAKNGRNDPPCVCIRYTGE